jgi:hypothetical protein
MAKAAGVSRNAWYNYEDPSSNHRDPQESVRERLELDFGVPSEWIKRAVGMRIPPSLRDDLEWARRELERAKDPKKRG